MKGLEPTWPGIDAEARGLTASIWEFMKNCWEARAVFKNKAEDRSLGIFAVTLTGLKLPVASKRNGVLSRRQVASGGN